MAVTALNKLCICCIAGVKGNIFYSLAYDPVLRGLSAICQLSWMGETGNTTSAAYPASDAQLPPLNITGYAQPATVLNDYWVKTARGPARAFQQLRAQQPDSYSCDTTDGRAWLVRADPHAATYTC